MTNPPAQITVLLADASDVTRSGLRALLQADPRFHVVGDVEADVVAAASDRQPDVIVLDPANRSALDVQVIDELHRVAPGARLVILTSSFEPHTFMAAMLKRVHGYLLKDSGGQGTLLLEAIALIARFGIVVVGSTIAEYFWSLPGSPIAVRLPGPGAQSLTGREREVLLLLVEGLTDQVIASRLGIKASTVEYHVRRLRERLGVRTRSQLTTLAVEQGLARSSPQGFPWDDPP